MSDYQRLKQRALELQKEKEAELKLEQAKKVEREKQAASAEAERKTRLEQQAKEARRRELMAANAKLVSAPAASGPATSSMDYNPFAEDERPTRPLASIYNALAGPSKPRVPSKSNGSGSASPRPGSAAPRSRSNGHGNSTRTVSDRAKDKDSPPPLGRKEKAAKAFLQRAKKASAADSVFSIRHLVEGQATGGSSTSGGRSPLAKAASPMVRSSSLGHVPPSKPVNGTGRTATSTGNLKKQLSSGVGSGKKGDFGDLRKLCPDRDVRDRRTIDEIHWDIKAKKGELPPRHLTSVTSLSSGNATRPSSSDGLGAGDTRLNKANGVKRRRSESPALSSVPKVKSKLPPVPSSARTASRIPAPVPSSARKTNRNRSASPSTSESASTDYSEDEDQRPQRRSHRDGSLDPADISATIQSLFARPGQQPRKWDRRDVYSDEESDMEAGLSDVEEEERRAMKMARMEDAKALAEEEARKRAKDKLKKDREREAARLK